MFARVAGRSMRRQVVQIIPKGSPRRVVLYEDVGQFVVEVHDGAPLGRPPRSFQNRHGAGDDGEG